MKLDRHIVSAFLACGIAAGLIAGIWTGTLHAVRAQREDNRARVETMLSTEAAGFSEQIGRQIDAVEQALRFLATAWAQDPAQFDLGAWRGAAVALAGVTQDIVLAGADGVIRQSSIGEAVGQTVADMSYFRAVSGPDAAAGLYVGPPAIEGIMRQWHMNFVWPLHNPDGSFAGLIDTDFRISTIIDAFAAAGLGPEGLLALIGTDDGRMRGMVGPAAVQPGTDIMGTAMFRALRHSAARIWTGMSATDGVRRIHAFHPIPGRNLMVVVAASEDDAMQPAVVWQRDAELFASAITILLCAIPILLIRNARKARARSAEMIADRALLAATQAQLEVARAEAAAKSERLDATMRGMTEGVMMLDAQLCLTEWNGRFADVASVPADILRVGLPVEQILRAQVASGQFGRIDDAEAEVQRRVERFRAARFPVTRRLRPDGHVLELRRSRLPDGGIITLYTDITDQKQPESSRDLSQQPAPSESTGRPGLSATASRAIQTPLATLLNAVGLLSKTALSAGQQELARQAAQAGNAACGLLDTPFGSGPTATSPIHAVPFELRPLLEGSADLLSAMAAEQGVTFRIAIDGDVPRQLIGDPGYLRQVILNLLAYAVRHGHSGDVWIYVMMTGAGSQPLRLEVRDAGPCIDAVARARLFASFAQLRSVSADDAETGLSVSRHLTEQLGGGIGCDVWSDGAASGNTFWLTLPASALPRNTAEPATGSDPPRARLAERIVSADDVVRRRAPRSAILLVEDVAANQFVTATLLRREGHHVDIADSGPVSIQALKNRPYDVVLMDIFMPGMSGLEATRAIRAIPGPVGAVPVIALTAAAAADDAARCQAAGINGMLRKPLALADLQQVLLAQIWRPASAAGSAAGGKQPEMPAEPGAEPVVSAEQIQDIRSNLPPAVFLELVEECISDLENRLPALRRAIMAQAPASITTHAHAMAGVAAGYGLIVLDSKLRAVLQMVREDRMASLDASVIGDIESSLRRSAADLRAVAANDPVSGLPSAVD
ncbi:MAG TPA: PAS-domain containing protein [Rhodopila sp.]|nr:PAS-domain containing protein [Rhodopila sp.]